MTLVSLPRVAGLAGLGFVLALLVANVVLTSAGFPAPASGADFGTITSVFVDERDALRLASSFLPAAWLLATVFAAGVFELVRRTEPGWAVIGLAGILMQSVAFVAVEASRLALGSAAVHDPGAVPGWLGATYTSIVVSMVAAVLLGKIGRGRIVTRGPVDN